MPVGKKTWLLFCLTAVLAAMTARAFADNAPATSPAARALAVATFSGGCFWCVQADFDKVPGVVKTVAGFTGGHVANPSYEQVSRGGTGHRESVEVYYDPGLIRYEGLLAAFWRMIDPTDGGGQFVDRGRQYTTAIYYHNDAQKLAAARSRDALARGGRYAKPIVTAILPAVPFYPAEAYHQEYHIKHPLRYRYYRYRSGRDQYLSRTWGKDLHPDYLRYAPAGAPRYAKPAEAVLHSRLTPLQFAVTQKGATEQPFKNPYWDETRDGIYVDIVTGAPLFSSRDKFDSGTGWPSFTRPLEQGYVMEKLDFTWLLPRVEVRSRYGGSHLGHVFDDGPPPTGLRYCVNSAALRFVPKDDLAKEGYGRFLTLFQ